MVRPRASHSQTAHSTPNRHNNNLTLANNCKKIISLICVASTVLVGVAILVTWAAIKPKKVHYSIDKSWIQNYNLATDNKLNSTFNFVVRTYNPSFKASVYYDSIDITVYYRGTTVASSTFEPFFQPHKNVTTLLVQNSAQNVELLDNVAHDLKVERTGGEVDMDVKIEAKIRVKLGAWKKRYKLKVLCSPVVVSFNNHKKARRTDCKVGM